MGGVPDNCLCPQKSKTVPNSVGTAHMGLSVGLLDVPPLLLVQMKRQAPFPHSFPNCSKEAIPGNGQLLLQNNRYQ